MYSETYGLGSPHGSPKNGLLSEVQMHRNVVHFVVEGSYMTGGLSS